MESTNPSLEPECSEESKSERIKIVAKEIYKNIAFNVFNEDLVGNKKNNQVRGSSFATSTAQLTLDNETSSSKPIPDLPAANRSYVQFSEHQNTALASKYFEVSDENFPSATMDKKIATSSGTFFADTSSFRMDEIYASGIGNQGESEFQEQHLLKPDESDIDFRADQISARSSTVSPITKSLIADTSVAIDSSVLAEFKTGQNLKKTFSDSEFLSTDEGCQLIEKDEQQFEEDHALEIPISITPVSQFTSWTVSSEQTLHLPLLSTIDGTNSALEMSVGHVFAAKTENLGSLSDDPNRERPFLGHDVTTPPSNRAVASTKLRKKQEMTSVAEGNISHQDNGNDQSNDCDENSIISLSKISKLTDDITLSEDASVIVNKFLKNAAHGKMNECHKSKKNGMDKEKIEFDHACASYELVKSNIELESMPRSTASEIEYVDENSKNNAAKSSHCDKSVLLTNKDELNTSSHVKNVMKSKSSETYSGESGNKKPPVYIESCGTSQNSLLPDVNRNKFSGSASVLHMSSPPDISSNEADSDRMSEKNISTESHASSGAPVSCRCQARAQLENPSHCRSASAPLFSGSSHDPYYGVVFQNPNYMSLLNRNLPSTSLPNEHVAYANNLASAIPMHPLFSGYVPNYSTFRLPVLCFATIIGPSEFYQPAMCVGDSSNAVLEFKNPSNVTLFYHVSCTSVIVNDAAVSAELAGLDFTKYCCIQAGHPFNIMLSFACKFEGKFQANLQILPSLFAQNVANVYGATHTIKLMFEVEEPKIRLSYNKNPRMDIFVMEKSNRTEWIELSIMNRSSLPLRIEINGENEKDNHKFSFDSEKVKSSTELVGVEYGIIMTTVILCRIPRADDSSEERILKIPVDFHAGKCNEEAETVAEAVLSVKIEGPVKNLAIGSLSLSASIGAVLISLHPRCPTPRRIEAEKGSKKIYDLSIINKGTISAGVSLSVDNGGEEFFVFPSILEMPPQHPKSISVVFKPLSQQSVEGMLQARVCSSDLVFDLCVVTGIVVSPLQEFYEEVATNVVALRKSRKKKMNNSGPRAIHFKHNQPHVPAISTNKKQILWGGVNIGREVRKNIILRNISSLPLKVKVFVQENSDGCFQIIDENGHRSDYLDLSFMPGFEKQVKISFTPNLITSYTGSLVIRTLGESKQGVFMVPLVGYGGTSRVLLTDFAGNHDSESMLKLISNSSTRVAFGDISVCNFGSRPAFVKIIMINDSVNDDSRFSVEPQEFILMNSETKVVAVKCLYFENNSDLEKKQGLKTLVCYHGDEVLRQNMRRLEGKGKSYIPEDPSLKFVNFDKKFMDEEKVPIDDCYPDSSNTCSLFYSSLHAFKLDVAFKDPLESTSNMSEFSTLSFFSTCSTTFTHLSGEETGVLKK